MQETKKSKTKKRMTKRELRKNLVGYLFILPMVIHLVCFTAVPFVYSLYLSMTDKTGLLAPNWVGLKNYIDIFTKDTLFPITLKVTFNFAFVQVPIKLAFALMVAMLLTKASKGLGFYRIAFYVPSILGGSVAVAMTWKVLWGSKGAINAILDSIGLPTVNWLKDPKVVLYVLILLGVWQFGSSMLIFLAGLNEIPKELYEAATIDGATGFGKFFKITLPLLTPSLFFNLINQIIGCLQAFNSAYLVTKGGPVNSTMYYSLNVYNQAFEYNKFGYASALAWVMMLIILCFTALIFKSSSGWVYYNEEN